MNKEIIECLKNLFFGILFVIGGTVVFVKHVYVDLENSEKITGAISHVFETEKRGHRATVRLIAFTVEGSDQIFAIRKSTAWANSNLPVGDTITVNYKSISETEPNVNVFQIKKQQTVLLDYKSYKRGHSFIALMLATIGIVIISRMIYKLKKINRQTHE